MDHVLDVSDLPAPEPLERTLDALSELPAGDRLVLRLRREPVPLYSMLRTMGYRWQAADHQGTWEILIESEASHA